MPATAPIAPEGPPTSSHNRILLAAKTLFATRGYENTSTAAISRMAGTSESQLIKHFGSKEGLLEAIFDEGWAAMSEGLRPLQGMAGAQRLRAMMEVVLSSLQRDPELKQLMLLEGRRVRKEGHMILLTSGFLELVQGVDSVLEEMRASGQLRHGLSPEAARSALLGMLEGLLRDQLLATRMGYRAGYGDAQLRQVFELVLAAFFKPA
jgi:AcrR family transcriptional regulator